MDAVTELASEVGASAACQALCLPRASYYRVRRKTSFPEETRSRPLPASKMLGPAERESVLACLHQERFQDRSPAAVCATLLDEGEYLCSIRSYVSFARETRGVPRTSRSDDASALQETRTAGHGFQSALSDITKLLANPSGPISIYVILDVFSRYIARLDGKAMRESAELAKRLIEESCRKQCIQLASFTLHADRDSMSSKPVVFLLADLGVTKTHSCPRLE